MSDTSTDASVNLSGTEGEGTAPDAAEAFAQLLSGEKKRETAPEGEQLEQKAAPDATQEAEPEDTQEAEEPRYKVKVNGQEIEVSLQELQQGYSRDSDYRQKTTALAEERRALEQQRQQVSAEREQAIQVLQSMQQRLPEVEMPDLALIETDPQQYLKLRAQYEQTMLQRQQIAYQRQQLEAQHAKEQEQAQAQYLSEQQQALMAALPEWSDPAKAKQDTQEIRASLSKAGYAEQEIDSLMDHRAVLVARKAMLYDKLVSEAQAASKKVSNLPPKVERPGTSNQVSATDGRTSAMKQLRSSGGSLDAAASVFEKLI